MSILNCVRINYTLFGVVLQEMLDAIDGLPADTALDLFDGIVLEITCPREMVVAIDGLPADIVHDLFEGIVPEITLPGLQEISITVT